MNKVTVHKPQDAESQDKGTGLGLPTAWPAPGRAGRCEPWSRPSSPSSQPAPQMGPGEIFWRVTFWLVYFGLMYFGRLHRATSLPLKGLASPLWLRNPFLKPLSSSQHCPRNRKL